jgi:LuxR family maltose regulon positive regulatory protein
MTNPSVATQVQLIRDGSPMSQWAPSGFDPDERAITAEPWLGYAQAWRLLPLHEAGARREIDRAWDGFERSGDVLGRAALAATALVSIGIRHADFRGVTTWLQRYASEPLPTDVPPLFRLRSHLAQLCLPGLDPTVPFDAPAVAASATAVYDALRAHEPALPIDEQLLAARLVLDYHDLNQDADGFRHRAALLQPLAESRGASPYWLGVWWWRLATGLAHAGDTAGAETAAQRARELAEHSPELAYAMAAEDLAAALAQENLVAAAKQVARLNALAPQVSATWQGHGMVSQARYHLLRREPETARDLCLRALRIYQDTELSERERDMSRSVLGQSHVLMEQEEKAIAVFEACIPHQTGGQRAMVEAMIQGARAVQALRTASADAAAHVAQVMAKARAINWHTLFFTMPGLAARLFEAALDHDIEPEFVAKAIRLRALAPPDPARERWPWALRIHALGVFSVRRDDQLLSFERKAQKKPLELLKALIASGGDGVSREGLAFALWRDPDADALTNFDVTLSRLRKLLDVEGALLLADGKLSLNRRLVWCDTSAFELRCARLQEALQTHAEDARVQESASSVFALYRDKLFGDEPAAPWSAAARERLALKFSRAATDLGAWLESRGQWRAAIDRYERGLAQQMLAEPLVRGLMRCHHALDENTEALLAFRRCRELLSMVLGVAPSAETEALAQRIRAG